ncbi:histidine kinase dimerization/phosphoacceptor domain -containing protein [Lactonifactor longoviformis]|uniref:histidine kinase dimerization/phosphoacceptor domain -containing protein n=1 Tax=Lactonifactor longoviformis TaxID=341220 RepID=UPI0036F29DEF
MFVINHVTGVDCTVLMNFFFQQERGTTQVLLSQDTVFLDELQDVITGKRRICEGEILLDGNRLDRADCCFIDRTIQVYRQQSIAENIFPDKSFFEIRRKKTQESLLELMRETGLELDIRKRTSQLSVNDSLFVEMLRFYERNPSLLLVRDISNYISAETHLAFVSVLNKMNERGTTILYLTNRIETAVRIRADLSVIRNCAVEKTYKAVDVAANPSSIFLDSFGDSVEKSIEKKEEQFLLSLHKLNHHSQSAKVEKDIKNMLLTFSQYAKYEMSASSGVIYLISQEEQRIIEKVDSSAEMVPCAPTLRQDIVLQMAGQNTISYLTDEVREFSALFTEDASIPMTMICLGMEFDSGFSLLLQMNYDCRYIYTKKDSAMLQWIAQEVGVYLENAVLMGNSILLRESHHRIKNNLQIIVSLLEMEKIVFPNAMQKADMSQRLDAVFDGTINRIKCIASIHDLLAVKNGISSCEIGKISKTVCDFYNTLAHIEIEAERVLVPYSKAVSVALVINELVCNSVKHNAVHRGERFEITIAIRRLREEHGIQILCKDNGIGFPGEMSKTEGTGIGQMIVESVIVLEFEGTIERYNDGGANIKIVIPEKAMLPIEKREIPT